MLRERPELKLSSHGRKMTRFERLAPEIEGLVAASGLNSWIECSLDMGDQRLMFAFVEHKHKETSSFHLPVREVTITLGDVASLLHLPIVGAFHSFEQLHVDDAVDMLVELLEVSAAKARAETIQCHGSYIVAARAYSLHLLGCTLFANKSATHVHVVFLDALRDLMHNGIYAWGAVALVHMYDNLNEASKSTARQLVGYITLLQCWIYEHFLSFGSTLATEDYNERRPHACRWTSSKALLVSTYRLRLDRMTPDVVCWILYGDHRSFREFEVITFFDHLRRGPLMVIHQLERVTILPHPAAPSVSYEEMDDRWMQFSDYIALDGHRSRRRRRTDGH
ncbi:Protein MAIN-LIKE 1 [Glycine soja]